ncbi:MAG: 5-formaminoimidazole-4-carboxamide-1-(beta)-D-ribofuranosyl 5'-monophosphate synthetase [Oceanicoccus sp.]|jgi:5-formaminoimidazole-4-carboxamide-1-(beta)-D-ribofuranosyl 5'-monophosphate synthetase
MDISKVLAGYDTSKITIGVLGGHSALDVCEGAHRLGFKTLVVCQKGREKTYEKYYKRRGDKGCIDETIIVEKFADIVKPEIQEQLRAQNTIFIHNRYFWVYCNFDEIENDFHVPIYGSREMVRLEERDVENNQYELLEKAGIRIPEIIRPGGSGMDDKAVSEALHTHFETNKGGPLIVKVNEAHRSYERAFFVCTSPGHFNKQAQEAIDSGHILKKDLDNSVIEEFIIGAQVNFNFFYSVITGELELMGTDARRQTSLDGFLRLDAVTQTGLINGGYKPSMVETGHYSVTTKESIIEKIFDIGEKFVELTQKEVSPGIIGPFALQGAVAAREGREELVIFDVSMRIPGSPGTRFTPHTTYLWGKTMSYGERIAMEIKEAVQSGRLPEILT